MENEFRDLFDRQAGHFRSDATKSVGWRLEQLDRMVRMLQENRGELCAALYEDFRKPPFEQSVEIDVPLGAVRFYRDNLEDLMRPREVEIPSGLAATGHRGIVYREPYGATLVIGPFNAPILLLLDPAMHAGFFYSRRARACNGRKTCDCNALIPRKKKSLATFLHK